MKATLFMAGVLLLSSSLLANELDEIEIDMNLNSNSNLLKQTKIIGCTDHSKKKEESCSKKPEEAILSKLPTSQQMNEIDLDKKEDNTKITKQLTDILKELSTLKEAQKADRETIKELKSIIKSLSSHDSENKVTKITTIKKQLNHIQKKRKRTTTTTRIRKPIKEISRDGESVIIEVQNNESLSTYAQYYYNDNTQYYKIYKANKGKISKNFDIIVGEQLRIPLN